ncbi:MAG TPA: sugar ABC transporter ATP-binding protein [Nocardioides sp.]|nr:sugar ABC transporter ATP-binding protein [Nocardioides sp.]
MLHDIDFEVRPGTVHALLGPNGAGKSTLIKCISGVQSFDRGEVTLDGDELDSQTPSAAFNAGIATIHQHLSLIDSLSVSDNIFLGREVTAGPLVNKSHQQRETQRLLEQFGIPVRPSTRVGGLPVGVKQLIEVAKAWHRTQIRVLILDEPTSALTEDETLRLFAEVERMKTAGVRIIYITHRLGELYRIADEVSVIRDGGVALSGPIKEIEPQQIVAAIAGRSHDEGPRAGASTRITDRAMLRLEGLQGPRFGPVDVEVRAGEIVGLYGVLGSGRSSCLETVAGGFAAERGRVVVDETPVRNHSPAAAIRAGIAFVPSDRASQALWGTLEASANMLMPSFREFASGLFRSRRRERESFHRVADQLELQPPDMQRAARDFSGGNQQKIVLGRWTQSPSLRVLILDEPTQGVDVGARRKIYETCQELARRGVAILFASSDADEIVTLADRVVVVDDGQPIAEYTGTDITEESLLRSAHELI